MKKVDTLYKRFKAVFAPNLHNLAICDLDTKIRLLFITGISVDESFTEGLHENAIVVLDNQNRIVEYTSKEINYLVLKRKHRNKNGMKMNIPTATSVDNSIELISVKEDLPNMQKLINKADFEVSGETIQSLLNFFNKDTIDEIPGYREEQNEDFEENPFLTKFPLQKAL